MAGATPEEAVDAFVGRIRAVLDCILLGTAFGSGNAIGVVNGLTLYTEGQAAPNVARLSTHGGDGDLLFRFALRYTVVRGHDDEQREPYEVRSSSYQYRILDYEENEIVVYHWEPEGISPVRVPHLHMPAAPSTMLPQRRGSRLADEKTHLGKLHLPTGCIFLEDIAELLIREFAVDPRRDDWEAVLAANREAMERRQT